MCRAVMGFPARALLAAAACATAVCGNTATRTQQSTLLIFEEVQLGVFDVVVSQASHHPTDAVESECHPHHDATVVQHRGGLDSLAEHHYNLHYRLGHLKCTVGLHGDDRAHPGTRSEWKEDDDPWYLPGFLKEGKTRDVGVFIKHNQLYSVHIHADAADLIVRSLNGTLVGQIQYDPSSGREASALQADGVTHGNVQTAGDTESTQNIVFLSSGYLNSDVNQFVRDVNVLVEFLQEDRVYPLSRYFPLVNVFYVFQASTEAGASKPANGLTVDNNLRCTYGEGTTSEPARALTCNRALSIALCDTSPTTAGVQNTLTIVVVNDVDYGGTGVFQTTLRLATVYGGELRDVSKLTTVKSLFLHEVGHALTDLSDEYTVSVTEDGRNCGPPWDDLYDRTKRTCRKNCAGQTTDLGWQGWIDAGKLPTPTIGCYYSNFYKPGTLSGEPCLMEKVSGTKLCPVCREASTLQLYTNGLNLTHPSCPHPEWAVVYLAQDQAARDNGAINVTFFASDQLYGEIANLNNQNEFTLKWEVDGVDTGTSFSYFQIGNAAALSVGTHTVQLTVEDNTAGVLSANRVSSMASSIKWTVIIKATYAEVVDEIGTSGALDSHRCDSVGPFTRSLQTIDYVYYAKCTGPNGQCSFEYNTKLYEDPANIDDAVKAIEDWIFGMGGALLGGGICLFMLIYFCLVVWSDEPKRVMEDCFSKPLKYTRRIIMGANAFFVLAAIGIGVMLGVMYTEVGAVAKIGLLVAMGAVLVVFLVGVIGGTAAYSKKMGPLLFYGMLIMLVMLSLLIMAGMLYYIGYNSNDEGHQAQTYIADEWKSRVLDDPGMICTAQQKFKCSGWDVPCTRAYSTSQCPKNCEETNYKYSEACKVPVIEFVHKWLPIVASLMLIVVYLMLCTCLLVFMMFHILRKSRALDQQKQELLQDGPIEGLLSVARLHHGDKKRFRDNLKKEFDRFDINNDGHLDKLEFSEFFRQTIGVELTEEQLDLLFALIDIRGLGLIRIQDWMEVLVKTTQLSVEEAIDFLSERKERAAMMEDARRMDRLEAVDDDPNCPLELDEDNEVSYDQAFTCYGRLDDGAFETEKEEFLRLASSNAGDPLIVTTERYREHLMEKFKLNNESRKARAVIDGLPKLIDREGTGEMTWTDWMSTYFIRRDCYMELIKRQGQTGVRAVTGERQRDRMASIRHRASATGVHLKRPSTAQAIPQEAGPEEQVVISDADFTSVVHHGEPGDMEAGGYA